VVQRDIRNRVGREFVVETVEVEEFLLGRRGKMVNVVRLHDRPELAPLLQQLLDDSKSGARRR
jgi:hypothetical protein